MVLEACCLYVDESGTQVLQYCSDGTMVAELSVMRRHLFGTDFRISCLIIIVI